MVTRKDALTAHPGLAKQGNLILASVMKGQLLGNGLISDQHRINQTAQMCAHQKSVLERHFIVKRG